jgi:hypothetical protein
LRALSVGIRFSDFDFGFRGMLWLDMSSIEELQEEQRQVEIHDTIYYYLFTRSFSVPLLSSLSQHTGIAASLAVPFHRYIYLIQVSLYITSSKLDVLRVAGQIPRHPPKL